MEDLLVDPVMARRLRDGLFWLLVLPGVGWLAVCVFRSISPKTSAFLRPVQTFLGWSVVVVALVYGALILVFVGWLLSFIPF